MKAGLFTFHRADNFGAMLQAYALQQHVLSIGCECEFVDFDVVRGAKGSGLEAMQNAGPLVKKIQAEGKKREALFDAFREKYLKISEVYPMASADKLNDIYDIFIAGSDQIWNFRLPDVDVRYFLPFAKKDKCFSYAASFGSEAVPDNAKEACGSYLKRFSRISVREESGVQTVKELTDKDAIVCVDPTLLLDKEEWDKIADASELTKENFVFVYMLKYDAELMNAAKAYAKAKGLEVVTITGAFMPQCGFDGYSKYGINDWMYLVKNADAVFANSFHGTVFSVLFGKKLYMSELKGDLAARNGRIVELLNLAESYKDEEGFFVSDAQKASGKLKDRTEASKAYLSEILGK